MNLATLWAHERARVCAAHHAPATLSPPPGTTDAASHGGHALKRQSSSSSLAASAHGNGNGGAGGVKKKVSMLVRRESVYNRLIEESALPLAEPPADGARALCYERNEFAMEYADRAPRRFLQQHQHQQHAADAVVGATASEQATLGALGDALAGGATKPTKRKTSVLQPVGGSSSPAAMPKVTALVAAATGGFPRRNPRKRGNGNSLELAPHAFKPYVGDMFSTRGDYVEGMLYMSRMKRSHQLTFGRDASTFAPAGRGAMKGAVADAFSAAVAAAAVGNLNVTGGDSSSVGAASKTMSVASSMASGNGSAAVLLSEISPEEILQLRQRQRCSLTLSNWSSNPENARLMVQENVVEALILLCKASDGDRVTKLHCVTTFMNLSHVDELRSEIVQQGAVKTLVEIANDSDDDKTLRTACAVTLCNLCCCLEGEEEILVEDGAVSALSLLINEHPKTASICLGALYNLTCVREPYHKIESVLKVFLTLATSSSATTSPSNVGKHEIIAKAVCNLSNFKRVRLRLMEEGIVSAISNLIHANNSQIQQLLAYALLNLSAMRACRSELVAKGCLGALAALTNAAFAQDGETKCLVALSLWNLSKESGNRLRMVFEGFLLLVNDLCRGSSLNDTHAEAVRTVCARAVYNVSCNDETRLKLVERDAVSIVSSLSHRCIGGDGKKMCTLSLCNLLSVQQAAADIVSAGAITSLIELSMVTVPQQTLETRQLFSKALYGLCEMATTRCAVVQAGIIPAIIHLSSISLPSTSNGAVGARQAGLLSEIRARCTAALACLAADESLASAVCTPEVARSVVQILVQERFNIAIERVCCLCLSLLCRDEQCSLVVADEGAIEAVLSTCLETQDVETKASCCHVLASMSCHPSCCMALVNMGAVPVLSTLAKTGMSKGSGSTVHRCCAITLSNLSADREIRSILVKSSIVPLLSLLSNSYSEDSQRDCARVLCNLSSVEGHEVALVREGALGVLMMISMVRALQPATKETCVRAFSNLLTPATVRAMINEGIVKVLPVFAGLAAASQSKSGSSDVDFASSVVHAVSLIFGKLLCYDDGRQALRAESTALRALVSLRPHRQEEEEENLFESLLCGTVFYEELRERSVDAGIVEAVHQTVSECVSRGRPVSQIALMLFTLAKHDATRPAAASPSSLATLATFLSSEVATVQREPESVLYSVSTLCHLAWHESTRLYVSPLEITQPLTRLLHKVGHGDEACPTEPTVAACLLTLCCLSDCGDHLSAMLQEGIVSHLLGLMNVSSLDTRKLLPLVCILFRQLSNAAAFEAALTRSSSQAAVAIKLFCLLARRASAESDYHATLDCADTLCSITFLPPTTNTKSNNPNRPPPFVRRQSQPQLALRGSMAASSSVPPSTLISADVLETINILVSGDSDHLAETRWRCMAAVYAFSCIADYRHTLVRLGCSRLLVQEAARAHGSVSTVELATLRCCAGALCNLTIVSGANANANAQTMIEEEAVPALIQLAERENEEIREYCTLALSNLSSQSPKVESGAVSALLSLSLRPGNASGCELNSQAGVSRPPAVVNARHKEISSLPDHALKLELPQDVLNRKYEAAQGQASKPPPPHLLILAPDISMVGGLNRSESSAHGNVANTTSDGADTTSNREETMLRRRRSSSIGDMMGISPVTTPASGSNSSRTDGGGAGVEGDLRGWQTLSFPKIDPVESRALNLDMDDTTDPADADDAPATGSDDGNTSPADASGGESGREDGSDLGDARSESDDATSKIKTKAGSGPNTLSPLARVVIRKSQTSHAIQKLKSMRSGTLRNSATSSTSSLPLATVQETHEAKNPLGRSPSGRRLPGAQPSIAKSYSLQKLGTPKSLSVSHLADQVSEPHKPSLSVATPVTESPHEASLSDDSSPSIAAAAAAAMLYSAGPAAAAPHAVAPTTKSKPPKPAKTKIKSKRSAPELETRRVVAPVVTTIEDVQAQVKLLGLWS